MKQAFVVHVPELVDVSELNPAAYNPRKITPEKFHALKESIRTDGFLEPVVVQKDGFRIIGGHQRVKAIKELCVEACAPVPKIPCVVLDITDHAAKKLNIKLNKIQGEFEARMLGELLSEINAEETIGIEEASGLGFTLEEATKYIGIVDPIVMPDEPSIPTFGKSVTLSLEFTDVTKRDALKKLIEKRVEVEQKKSGEIVAEALMRPTRASVPPPAKKGRKKAA